MTLQELRQPQIDHITTLLATHKKTCTKCRIGDGVLESRGGMCDGIPMAMFLYDLLHHEISADEQAALDGGPVPKFLVPGEWEKA